GALLDLAYKALSDALLVLTRQHTTRWQTIMNCTQPIPPARVPQPATTLLTSKAVAGEHKQFPGAEWLVLRRGQHGEGEELAAVSGEQVDHGLAIAPASPVAGVLGHRLCPQQPVPPPVLLQSCRGHGHQLCDLPVETPPLGGMPGDRLPAEQLLDVLRDRAELPDLPGHTWRRHAELPARPQEPCEVGQVTVRGAEVLERVDAHDVVEAVLPEREGMRLGPHGGHLAGDAGAGKHGRRLVCRDPPVGRHDLDAVLPG